MHIILLTCKLLIGLQVGYKCEVDVNKTDNLCDYTKVDAGFSANRLVRDLMAKKKISDKQLMDFRMECRSFL